jgi:hypothetical protein
VELANAFGELTDPAEQRRRFEAEMARSSPRLRRAYPIDEDFLAALAIMPEASGCALGFDRLVMLATGPSASNRCCGRRWRQDGVHFGQSADKEVAKAAASRRARTLQDDGQACQIRVSGEHGFWMKPA